MYDLHFAFHRCGWWYIAFNTLTEACKKINNKVVVIYMIFHFRNRLCFFRDLPDYRILVCGGDGTVGWILDAIGWKLNQTYIVWCSKQDQRGFVCLALSSLSTKCSFQFLIKTKPTCQCAPRWPCFLLAQEMILHAVFDGEEVGAKPELETLNLNCAVMYIFSVFHCYNVVGYDGVDLGRILKDIESSSVVPMDRWSIQVTLEDSQERGDPVPYEIINNYFSIGVVWHIQYCIHLKYDLCYIHIYVVSILSFAFCFSANIICYLKNSVN